MVRPARRWPAALAGVTVAVPLAATATAVARPGHADSVSLRWCHPGRYRWTGIPIKE
jgi:hypothetical protein